MVLRMYRGVCVRFLQYKCLKNVVIYSLLCSLCVLDYLKQTLSNPPKNPPFTSGNFTFHLVTLANIEENQLRDTVVLLMYWNLDQSNICCYINIRCVLTQYFLTVCVFFFLVPCPVVALSSLHSSHAHLISFIIVSTRLQLCHYTGYIVAVNRPSFPQ